MYAVRFKGLEGYSLFLMIGSDFRATLDFGGAHLFKTFDEAREKTRGREEWREVVEVKYAVRWRIEGIPDDWVARFGGLTRDRKHRRLLDDPKAAREVCRRWGRYLQRGSVKVVRILRRKP